MSGTIRDIPREMCGTDSCRAPPIPPSKYAAPEQAPSADIAPWASTSSLGGIPATSAGLYENSNGKTQRPPSFRPDTAQSGTSDSPDPMFWGDDRRPSVISATSASSQTSNSRPAPNSRRAPHKKLAGFFGEDSRESSKGSDTSIATTGQRDPSTSSRSKRNNSIHTLSTDGWPTSETSSRPRTPPSSDVTPWLFQDFKVSPRVRHRYTDSIKFASAPIHSEVFVGVIASIGRNPPSVQPNKHWRSPQHP